VSKNKNYSKKSTRVNSASTSFSVKGDRLNYQTYSNNSPRPSSNQSKFKKRRGFGFILKTSAIIVVIIAGILIYDHYKSNKTQTTATNSTKTSVTKKAAAPATPAVAATTPPQPNACASNSLAQLALVSISQRRMWACQGSNQVYTSLVITGMAKYAADVTPTGTFYIYAKERDLYLNGSDSTGSWHDYVYYWMPFLDNQYGAYGFHDATWRPDNAFGNISPDSDNASHGCVEMPLSAATWLYNWASVGTTVKVES